MEDLFEEVYLNEDLPKDLAKAFRRGFERPRNADYSKHNYGYGDIKNKPTIDFKNSTYTEITPEQALQLYKNGDSRNVLAIIDGQLANTYLETDSDGNKKRTYDFKATGSGPSFTKENGKVGNNSMWLSPKEFYNNADKIYLANEVGIDQALRDKRRKNPEGRYNPNNRGSIANATVSQPRKKQAAGGLSSRYLSKIDFDSNGNARYDSSYVSGYADSNGQRLDQSKFYPLSVWQDVYSYFVKNWGINDSDSRSVEYIIDKLKNPGPVKQGSPLAYDWSTYNNMKNAKASLRYKDVENDLQRVINQGRKIVSDINTEKRNLERTKANKDSNTSQASIDYRKQRIQNYINSYQDSINRYMRELLKYQDQLDDIDVENEAEIARFDKQIADIQDKIAGLQAEMKGLFNKKTESLEEDFNLIQLTKEDQASNIRSLIKTCWDNVDRYSMYAQQLNEFGSQQALSVVNTLINDLYIAIGSFEEALGDVDQKSAALDAVEEVQVVAQVAPQVVQQMAPPQVVVPMIEKFQLSEDDATLTEELDEKPEAQVELEEPIEKELKEVEKYRKEKVKDSMNPDPEDTIEETSDMTMVEDLEDDDSYNPKFFESLLKLED